MRESVKKTNKNFKKSLTNFSNAGTYISAISMGRLSIKKNLQLGISGFFLVIVVLGVIGSFTVGERINSENIPGYLGILIPSLFAFWLGLKNRNKIKLVYQYNSIFLHDFDGTVTIKEIEKITGKPSHKILSELEYLFQKRLFRDCMLQTAGIPCVILMGREGSVTSFVEVVCDRCNGTTRLRAGSIGKCEYCGNRISARDDL